MAATKTLEEYAAHKSDLMSLADQIEGIAGMMGNERAKTRTAALKSSLAAERFNLAVLGGFKRGKSTFVNALLGANLVPVGVVPLTSIVTKIVYGENREALVLYQDGRNKIIQIADLGQYITEKGNPNNKLKVAEVEVSFDSVKLKDGVTIVDTPGTGSTFTENTKVTHEFIDHADAGIFILSADPPIGEAEVDFLRMIKRSVDRLFFVQNKIDHLTEAEWQEALDFSAKVIKDTLGLSKVVIYPLSSKNALEAKRKGNAELFRESRFDAFENDLKSFLLSGKGDTILHNASTRLLQVAYELRTAIRLELAAADRPIEVLEAKLQWLREQNAIAGQRMTEAIYLINGKEREVAIAVENDLQAYLESERGRISERLKVKLENIDKALGRNDYLSSVASEMVISLTEELAPFMDKEQSIVSRAFEATAKRFQQEANEIIGSIHHMAASAFNISLPYNLEELTLASKPKFWLDIQPVISYDLLFVGEIKSALPKTMLRRMVEKRAAGMIWEELEKNTGRYKFDLMSRLSESIEKLRREFRSNLKEVVEATENALVLSIATKQRTVEEANARIHSMTDVGARLDQIINELL
jgi:GTP-binding protein EngB required for normal cell division